MTASRSPAAAGARLTVSIVVVTRDRPRRLATLLASLCGQTVLPDQVVIVNNASLASYDDVLREYRGPLPLTIVEESTPGIPQARNCGVRAATGDVIVFTDDDCEAEPSWVENIVRPFYQNPHIGAVGGEILSRAHEGTLVEEFCVSETLMRLGREGEPPPDVAIAPQS